MFSLKVRSPLSPLKKLSLELGSDNCYDVRDFELLCDALFSFPQLGDLKLTLGKGFADILRQQHYEDVMYKCWSDKGNGVKLKSISLQTDIEIDVKKVTLITHNLSLSFSQHKHCFYCHDH